MIKGGAGVGGINVLLLLHWSEGDLSIFAFHDVTLNQPLPYWQHEIFRAIIAYCATVSFFS